MISSQLQAGSMPDASTNTITTTKFRTKFRYVVSTTDSGITSRGKCTLRTSDSWSGTDDTDVPVASA